jgi:prepilin peptidase CpaA
MMVLCVLLAAAAASDAALRRVPNALAVAVAVLGLATQAAVRGASGAFLSGGAALLVMAALMVPFSRRMIGGGDVKLVGACTIWTGFGGLPVFLLATAVAGGIVALVTAAWALHAPVAASGPAGAAIRAAPGGRRAQLRTIRVPYSIAIAVGAVIALRWRLP